MAGYDGQDLSAFDSSEQAATVSSTCHDSPEPEIKCDTVVAKSELTDCDQHETVAVKPCEKPPVIASSTCPELEIKCDKVGKCEAAASVLLYDGPATITSSASPACPDTSCDRKQDASQVRELGTGSDNDNGKEPEDHIKKEIVGLESKLLELWNRG